MQHSFWSNSQDDLAHSRAMAIAIDVPATCSFFPFRRKKILRLLLVNALLILPDDLKWLPTNLETCIEHGDFDR